MSTSNRLSPSPLRLAWSFLVPVLVLVGVLAGCSTSESDASPEIDSLAFTTLDGESATLADFEGQPLVVNFFASWCPPCRAEMPAFEEVHQEGDVTILGVSHDFDETTWRSMIAETGITFDTVFQPDQEIYSAVDGVAMPTTIFVDANGEVVGSHTGPLTADQLRANIDDYLLS